MANRSRSFPGDYTVSSYLIPPYSSTIDQSIPTYTYVIPRSPHGELESNGSSPRPHSLSSASDQPYFYRTSPVPAQESQDTVRVVHSRPKPQCWDHGCN